MIVFPNAKINLGLQVLHRRPDGFHAIDSIFYPVPFKDALEALPDEDLSPGQALLECSGLPIPGDQSGNLVLKAYHALHEEFSLPGTRFWLHKVIPMGAGLGGGSADGAFALKLLNDLYQLGLSDAQMEAFAARLGSDCPFFIRNSVRHVTGRGEVLGDLELSLKNYWIVLVNPALHVGTAEAYAGISPRADRPSLAALASVAPSGWKDVMENDFEVSVGKIHPVILEIKAKLYEFGASYAQMTGSGSTVYGLFDEEPDQLDQLWPNYGVWKFLL